MLRVFWTLRSRCPRGLTGAELTSDLGAAELHAVQASGRAPWWTGWRLRARRNREGRGAAQGHWRKGGRGRRNHTEDTGRG